MSMFHELMMRKKEEIMYATIKGTLTENDGVFSNFSTTSWLSLPPMPTANPDYIELNIKFNSGDMSLISYIWLYQSGENNDSTGLRIYNGSQIAFFVGYSNKYRAFNATANTDYWVRFTRGKTVNTSQLQYSTDGINYVTAINGNIYNSDTMEFSSINTNLNMRFGRSIDSSSNYLKGGSIDLNASSIKISSTKYNLQAVVGYTVVGSPTITDGVVSGFSSANYLYLPSAPSWSNIDVLETFTTFTTSTMNTLQIVMGSRYSQASCCVEITSANKTLFRITYSDSGGTTKYKETTINYVLSANTKYKVKNYFNKQTLVIKSELYDENGIMLASASSSLASDYTSIANINDFWYGSNPQRGTFSGSIDFNNNNTYVKINNKLWFNGQQA